jgi:hypothetical protein
MWPRDSGISFKIQGAVDKTWRHVEKCCDGTRASPSGGNSGSETILDQACLASRKLALPISTPDHSTAMAFLLRRSTRTVLYSRAAMPAHRMSYKTGFAFDFHTKEHRHVRRCARPSPTRARFGHSHHNCVVDRTECCAGHPIWLCAS